MSTLEILSHTRNPGELSQDTGSTREGTSILLCELSSQVSGRVDILSCLDGAYTVGGGDSNPLPFPNSSNLCAFTFFHLFLSIHNLYKVRGESITIPMLQVTKRDPYK